MEGVSLELAQKALSLAAQKLPIRTKVIHKAELREAQNEN